jgi:hypothetical protein
VLKTGLELRKTAGSIQDFDFVSVRVGSEKEATQKPAFMVQLFDSTVLGSGSAIGLESSFEITGYESQVTVSVPDIVGFGPTVVGGQLQLEGLARVAKVEKRKVVKHVTSLLLETENGLVKIVRTLQI